jgi:hypothetical protein
MGLLMAAVASVVDPAQYPPRSAAEWSALLGRGALDDRRLLDVGLCSGDAELFAHPGVVSRLRGRDRLESPAGLRLRPAAPGESPERAGELAAALVGPALGVIHGGGPRRAIAAAVAAKLGWELLVAYPRIGASPGQLAHAVIEATLFRSLVAIDLDRWRELGVDLVTDGGAALAARGPLFVLAADDPAIAARHRAFTLGLDAVRSAR